MNKETKRSSIVEYIVNSVQELRKVSWPTKKQSIRMTFLVLGFCLVAAIVIGIIDFAFYTGHEKLIQIAPQAAVSTGNNTALPGQISDSQTATPVTANVVTPEGNKANLITIEPGTQSTVPKN